MKMADVITIIDSNGQKLSVEVSREVYEFDKEYYWKEDYQEYKKRKHSDDRKFETSLEGILEFNNQICNHKCLPNSLTTESAETQYIKKFQKETLYKALGELSEKQRRRFILHFLNRLTFEEIAVVEKTTHSAIVQSVQIAAKIVRSIMQNGEF